MTNVALTPVALTPDDSLTNITGSTTALSGGTTMTVPYGSQTIIVFQNVGTSATVAVTIASTVLGQAVTSYSALTIAENTTQVLGPFHSAVAGSTGVVTIDLTTPTSLSAIALNVPGVY